MRLNLDTFILEDFAIGYSYYSSIKNSYIDLFGKNEYYRYFLALQFVYEIVGFKNGRMTGDLGLMIDSKDHNRIIEMIETKVGLSIDEISNGELGYL